MNAIKRALISGWCIWHMIAVAVFALPHHAPDQISTWLRQHVSTFVEPYLFATSQWQYWHMFVAERPPQESKQFFQGLNQQGREINVQPISPHLLVSLASFCSLPPHPASVRLISRTYFSVDQHLPARSDQFRPRWWEEVQAIHLCSTS